MDDPNTPAEPAAADTVAAPLTVAKLKSLTWATTLHLNRGKHHDLVRENEEYCLFISTTTAKPGYRVVRRVLYAKRLSKDEHTVDLLLRGDLDARLERFCAAYNAAESRT